MLVLPRYRTMARDDGTESADCVDGIALIGHSSAIEGPLTAVVKRLPAL